MKRIVIYVLVSIVTVAGFAQNKDNGLVGISAYLSVGLLPYGYNSIGERSDKYIGWGEPNTSILVGLDYKVNDTKMAFFIEGSLRQNFKSTEWQPFMLSEIENDRNGKVISFETETNSVNGGILIGGDLTEELELFAKVGVGTSFHSYILGFAPSLGDPILTETTQRSLNYQLGLELKYFPIQNVGVISSWSVAHNFPLFSIGMVSRF